MNFETAEKLALLFLEKKIDSMDEVKFNKYSPADIALDFECIYEEIHQRYSDGRNAFESEIMETGLEMF